jgi:hypothetical protein
LEFFFSYHQQQQSLITLAVTERTTSRYLLFNKFNRLCGWRNAKTGEEKMAFSVDEPTERAYSGITLFEPEILALFPLAASFLL